MIVSISGKLNSGKDTVGKIWQIIDGSPHFTTKGIMEFLNKPYDSRFENKKWADSLKDMVCILLGCSREQLEDREFKEKELGEEWTCYKVTQLGKIINKCYLTEKEALTYIEYASKYYFKEGVDRLEQFKVIKVKMTPRLLLQLLGTECGRQIIHPNIWCNSLFSDYNGDVEKWINIIGYENSYQVSSFGRVKSLDRKIVYGEDNGQYHTKKSQILKPTLSGGYETVSLSGKTFTIHSLVAKHFVKGYQEGFVVNHIDYNKTNNFYKNLEWITQEDNIKHNKTTLRGNFGESQKDAKLDSDKVLGIKKLIEDNILSQNKIAKLFDVSPTTISDIKKGKKWNHVGKDVVKIEPILPIPVPNWIITDVRFPNELEAVKSKDGISIRVNREIKHQVEALGGRTNVPKGYFPTNQHESETALDSAQFDYVIDNNGTIEELIDKVRKILEKRLFLTLKKNKLL